MEDTLNIKAVFHQYFYTIFLSVSMIRKTGPCSKCRLLKFYEYNQVVCGLCVVITAEYILAKPAICKENKSKILSQKKGVTI